MTKPLTAKQKAYNKAQRLKKAKLAKKVGKPTRRLAFADRDLLQSMLNAYVACEDITVEQSQIACRMIERLGLC